VTRALFVSNGHGEDVIAAALACRLQARGVELVAVPLVGRGGAYERIGVTVLGPRSELPGGGFTMMSLAAFWADLRGGLVPSTLRQWRAVADAAADASFCVAVGDRYAVGVARYLSWLPTYFLHVNRSAASWPSSMPPWRPPFGPLERMIMRGARAVYPRDGASARWLQARGLRNVFDLGNPMLEALDGEAGVDVVPPWVMGLPGTRADAHVSFPVMLEAMRRPAIRNTELLVAWAAPNTRRHQQVGRPKSPVETAVSCFVSGIRMAPWCNSRVTRSQRSCVARALRFRPAGPPPSRRPGSGFRWSVSPRAGRSTRPPSLARNVGSRVKPSPSWTPTPKPLQARSSERGPTTTCANARPGTASARWGGRVPTSASWVIC